MGGGILIPRIHLQVSHTGDKCAASIVARLGVVPQLFRRHHHSCEDPRMTLGGPATKPLTLMLAAKRRTLVGASEAASSRDLNKTTAWGHPMISALGHLCWRDELL